MAAVPKEPLLDASIVIDGIDFSTIANKVQIEDSAEEHDVTGFQGGGYKEETSGLKTAVFNITFFQDYTEGGLHQTLSAIYRNREKVPVKIKPDDGPISADNPEWEIVGQLFDYNPIDAEVGQPQSLECAFRNGSSAGLVERTEP